MNGSQHTEEDHPPKRAIRSFFNVTINGHKKTQCQGQIERVRTDCCMHPQRRERKKNKNAGKISVQGLICKHTIKNDPAQEEIESKQEHIEIPPGNENITARQ